MGTTELRERAQHAPLFVTKLHAPPRREQTITRARLGPVPSSSPRWLQYADADNGKEQRDH